MKTKDSEDMSMEEILASIRQYVSATNDNKAPDEEKIEAAPKENAKVIPIKEEAKSEIKIEAKRVTIESEQNVEKNEEDRPIVLSSRPEKKPVLANLQKLKALKKEQSIKRESSPSLAKDFNIMNFVEQMLEEKIQAWVDANLEDIVKERIDDVLEKVTSEQINNILQDEE